jgi:hypothetical protein
MKLVLSIPLIMLISFSGISVKFTAHFCGGTFIATKVLITGELATCGMEIPSNNNSSQNTFSNHCCDNITSEYSINNNYIPSSYYIKEQLQKVVYTISVPVDLLCNYVYLLNPSNLVIRPPGNSYPNSVTLPVLCSFRN